VHNVREVELGALLWALDFGGSEECRHSLGTARPYGYGSVTLRTEAARLRAVVPGDNTPDKFGQISVDGCVRRFEDYMEHYLDSEDGWAHSEQILSLLELARPIEEVETENYRPMLIDHPEYNNEFSGVKLAGYALPPAVMTSVAASLRSENRSQREERLEKYRSEIDQQEQQDAEQKKSSMSFEELAQAELTQAHSKGVHLPLLRQWMQEAQEIE